ncbi:hypothetical protein LZ30DRAFT_437598 [Colletotrichum cereale]|nr:hypothetical protein LZ30DRAFT_437598 [Colletotrichum cereale]
MQLCRETLLASMILLASGLQPSIATWSAMTSGTRKRKGNRNPGFVVVVVVVVVGSFSGGLLTRRYCFYLAARQSALIGAPKILQSLQLSPSHLASPNAWVERLVCRSSPEGARVFRRFWPVPRVAVYRLGTSRVANKIQRTPQQTNCSARLGS